MAAATATATAPWIKPKFASMFKTTSEALTAAAGTPNAINAFLAYVNAKKKAAGKPEDATHDNIVDELIEVMNAKQLFSGKINLTGNVLPLYQIMFGTTITRTQIFSHIKNWCYYPPQISIDAENLRKLTVFSNLAAVTAIGDPNWYHRDWDDYDTATNTGEDLSSAEIKFCKSNNSNISFANMKTIKKFPCGTCWICNNPIHFFNMYNKKSEDLGFLNGSCGEDEHLLPAGMGNIFGSLLHDYDSSLQLAGDTNSLMNMGLRASHTWCNRCKSDLAFVNAPLKGAGYTINNAAISDFIETAKNWLTPVKQQHYSNEIQFNSRQTPKQKNTLINQMRTSILLNMNKFCNMANSLVTTTANPTPDIYTAFLLRMIWYGCLLCTTLYDKANSIARWNSPAGGGKNQHGGRSPEDLIDIFFQIMSNPEAPEITPIQLNSEAVLLEPSGIGKEGQLAEISREAQRIRTIQMSEIDRFTPAAIKIREERQIREREERHNARDGRAITTDTTCSDSDKDMDTYDISEAEKDRIRGDQKTAWREIVAKVKEMYGEERVQGMTNEEIGEYYLEFIAAEALALAESEAEAEAVAEAESRLKSIMLEVKKPEGLDFGRSIEAPRCEVRGPAAAAGPPPGVSQQAVVELFTKPSNTNTYRANLLRGFEKQPQHSSVMPNKKTDVVKESMKKVRDVVREVNKGGKNTKNTKNTKNKKQRKTKKTNKTKKNKSKKRRTK